MTIETHIPLAPFTTLRVGGAADYFARVRTTDELSEALAFAREKSLPVFLIGGGSNLLFDDAGFCGLVIKNEMNDVVIEGNIVTAGSGTPLGVVVGKTAAAHLDGLTTLAGLPGTLGGAIAGNAGSYGREIGDVVTSATIVWLDGKKEIVDHEWFHFGYRTSRLKNATDAIIANVTLTLAPSTDDLTEKIWQTARTRAAKEPGGKNAGSFWKNPSSEMRAWELIESAGLRGLRVGGAAISDKHANYIVNVENATSADIHRLAERVEEAVLATHGIRLEREVIWVPAGGR